MEAINALWEILGLGVGSVALLEEVALNCIHPIVFRSLTMLLYTF